MGDPFIFHQVSTEVLITDEDTALALVGPRST